MNRLFIAYCSNFLSFLPLQCVSAEPPNNTGKGGQTCPNRASIVKLSKSKKMDENQLTEVAEKIAAASIITQKEVLTSEEAARYMGISQSYLYKLTFRKEIPYYKPTGKMCFFNRAELEQWLQQNRQATTTEINDEANRRIWKGGRK